MARSMLPYRRERELVSQPPTPDGSMAGIKVNLVTSTAFHKTGDPMAAGVAKASRLEPPPPARAVAQSGAAAALDRAARNMRRPAILLRRGIKHQGGPQIGEGGRLDKAT
jgi:hypothetical protein